MMRILAILLAFGMTAAMAAGPAESPTTHVGPTYDIVEPDMLNEILARLKEKQDSGEILRLQKAAAKRAQDMFLHPKPVEGWFK